jgi:hypothetical protein
MVMTLEKRETIVAWVGFALATTIALCIAEIIARFFVPMPKITTTGGHLIIADETQGYKMAPNVKLFVSDGYFKMHIETNEAGLRDSLDPDLPNPGYIAIGDSTCFGWGVDADDSWPEQLQQILGRNVINAGMFGYGVNQYGPLLRDLQSRHYPIELVLYGMSGNDVYSGGLPPDYNIPGPEEFVVNPKYAGEPGIRTHSRLIEGWNTLSKKSAVLKLLYGSASVFASFIGYNSSKDLDEESPQLFEKTLNSLDELAATVTGMGAELIVVHVPDVFYSLPREYERHHRRHPALGRHDIPSMLQRWAEARGIRFGDTIDSIERVYYENGESKGAIVLIPDGHYTGIANRAIAERFAALVH